MSQGHNTIQERQRLYTHGQYTNLHNHSSSLVTSSRSILVLKIIWNRAYISKFRFHARDGNLVTVILHHISLDMFGKYVNRRGRKLPRAYILLE